MEKYDLKTQTIYYNAGVCSLNELVEVNLFFINILIINVKKIRNKFNIYWFNKQRELVFIAKEIISRFKILFSKGYYHSDLKPANIILIANFLS